MPAPLGQQPAPWAATIFTIAFLLYLPIIFAVYWVAENRGESGFFWAILCMFLPGVGPAVFIIWCCIYHIRNRKPDGKHARGTGTPDVELSRQRLYGGVELTGKTHDEIERLIANGDWDAAEALVKLIIEEAEHAADGGRIADMITYLERIKKGRRRQ